MIQQGGGVKVLKKILQELVLIRKELQAIRSSKEFNSKIDICGKAISQSVQKSICDISLRDGDTS